MPLLDVLRHVRKDLGSFCVSFFVLVYMVVGIQTETPFVCVWGDGGAHRTRVCGYVHMQYDTHTNWRREEEEEERADRASAKSAVARAYNDDAFFDFPSTEWGSIYKRGGVICS